MTYVQRRKYEAIDIVKILTGTHEKFYNDPEWYGDKRRTARDRWNQWLTKCVNEDNHNELMKAYYSLQLGMDNAVKQKLNTEGLCALYTRLLRSIENELIKILRKRSPHVLDNPVKKNNYSHLVQEKRDRDLDIHKFLRSNSF